MEDRYQRVSNFYSNANPEVPSLASYYGEAVDALTDEGLQTFGRNSRMAVIAGIPGSGKSTYIDNHYNLNEYFLISVDTVREWFLRNDLIPNIEWLSVSESSGYYQLMFFEISEKVTYNLMRERVDIISDITFRSHVNAATQLSKVAEYGYSCEVVLIDVDIEVAKKRAISRYLNDCETLGFGRVIPFSDYANFISFTGEELTISGDVFYDMEEQYDDGKIIFTRFQQ